MDEIELRLRLERIEGLLEMREGAAVRDWYTVDEVAAAVGLAEFTVREYYRLRRLNAVKRSSGRGAHCGWSLSHDELRRFRKEGRLPVPGLSLKG